MHPEAFYSENLSRLESEHRALSKKRSAFAFLRFGTLVLLIILIYFFTQLGTWYIVAMGLAVIILFRMLLLRDLKNRAAIAHLETLITINKNELKTLEGAYYQFANGSSLSPKEHLYANDIDIFGHASLFQYCNRTTSETGSKIFGSWLSSAASVKAILKRQSAIKELKDMREWSQQFQATGTENYITEDTRTRLIQWLDAPPEFLNFKHWQWLRIVMPVIICSVFIAALSDLIPMNVFYGSLLLSAVLAFQINKVISPIHIHLSKMADEMETLSHSLALIEKAKFTSGYLNEIKGTFVHENKFASDKIKKIKKILDRLDLRYNIVLSAPLNLLFFWNLQQVLELEKWKKDHAHNVAQWYDCLGTLEALNSFSIVYFNNPEWTFPQIAEEHFILEAKEIGHPLINKTRRQNNSISIKRSGELMVVTGSNMAGKSTYLRSIGINIILAMAGAPVCAEFMKVSHVQLLSSMRIADNLEENTSTFYAELKKLKAIIEKVNNNEKIFILLDEILRGTNSLDRHTGSVALMKQLIRHNASGIIATHDVQLAEMKKDFPDNILNYHFDAQVDNEELYFDYKLKPGICTSLNASILMKKIGIEL